jgi:Divergent InlB B-repeat domain/Peptidase_C39 like family/Fibronectin type III domain
MTKRTGFLTLTLILTILLGLSSPTAVLADSNVFLQKDALQVSLGSDPPPPEPDNPYFRIEEAGSLNNNAITKIIIAGPPTPPEEYAIQRNTTSLPVPNQQAGINTLANVPAFDWSHGCSATSAAMIAGYYDRTSFANMYAGPTNGGVMPMDNSVWGTWTDSYGDQRSLTPLSATKLGLDGRTTKGHIDDYWWGYDNSDADPFDGNWAEHTYDDCLGDYMKTNQTSNFGNADGATTFYTYQFSGSPLTCSEMENQGFAQEDGTYGVKLFYESRGYTVTECYSQKLSLFGGFTFSDYKAEIDAGYPVMFHVEGHTMVGVGYDDTNETMYIHDTWDYNTHTMPWGGSYAGMDMYAVSIVHLQEVQGTCYDLTLSHTGSGSDPSASPANSTGCSTGEYVAGETITLTGATPDAGWEINGWTGTDNNASTASSNTVTMPASAHSAGVTYTEIPPTCYALTVGHTGNGNDPSASPANSTGCSTGEYVAGETITLSGATPDAGWEISGWAGTDNNTSTADNNTVTMPASAHTAGVTYTEIPPTCYTLTVGHTGSGSDPSASPGNSTGCNSGQYVAGETISLSGATPDAGWEISGWTGTDNNSSTTDNNTVTMPASAHSAGVTYTEIPPTCYTLTVGHTGSGSDPSASPGNSTGCNSGQYVAGETITLSGATPASGWEINGWTGTNNDASTASSNTVTMPASSHFANVTYTEIPPTCYTLTVGHTGSGSDPSASPGNSTGCNSGQYVAGETISLSGATPDAGWEISGWTGTDNNSSTADNNTVTMPASAHSAGVTYTEIPPTCYPLTVGHTGSGSDPSASPENSAGCNSGQYVAGETITLSGATPASGWEISGWTGTKNDASTASSNTVTMPASAHTASVTYTEIPPTCYPLTVGHTGSGSDPSASPANSTGCNTGQYVAGETILLSGATPDSGWEISGWTGTENDATTANSNTVTMPASSHFANVIYTEIPPTCYTFTVGHTGSGSDPTASPGNSTGCSTGQYVSGETITLSGATPDSGWVISGWSGTTNDTSTASSNTVTMPAVNHSASVVYEASSGSGRYEEDSPFIIYEGIWHTWTDANASGGAIVYTNEAGASATLTFTGRQVTLVFNRYVNRGDIEVVIDGGDPTLVSQYSSALSYQDEWSSSVLTDGTHTVEFSHPGGSHYIDIDAIVISSPESLPPAAVTLNAATGSGTGQVDLSWNAPGDDGNTGTATAYIVRYADSEITTEGEWATATDVEGEPVPAAAGTPQTMTVSGLNPGQTYYFALRTEDEVPNLSEQSNSPSAEAKISVPVGVGTYEEDDVNITYSGTWHAWGDAKASGGGLVYTNEPGAMASLTFTGRQIKLVFNSYVNRGDVEVSIDGGAPILFSQYSSSLSYLDEWASPILAQDTHTVTFSHPGGSHYIDIDAMVVPEIDPSAPVLYQETDPAIGYTGNWSSWSDSNNSGGAMVYTNEDGASAELTYYGRQVKLIYNSYVNRGEIAISIDGGAPVMVNQYSGSLSYLDEWASPVLDEGTHTITLTHPGGTHYIDIDALEVSSPETDTVAPAAVNLNAATGSGTGEVDLSWNAPGDDDNEGTASEYVVRYADSEIVTEDDWNAAIDVEGEPLPENAGTAQSMTVSGLTPEQVYYFALRTKDDFGNLSGPSNSPSAAAQAYIPPGAGTYEEDDASITYSGTWHSWSDANASGGAMVYTNEDGASATMEFSGRQVKLIFNSYVNRGNIAVIIDGGAPVMVDQYSASLSYLDEWASPLLDSGTHTVEFQHPGGDHYVDIDAIKIVE